MCGRLFRPHIPRPRFIEKISENYGRTAIGMHPFKLRIAPEFLVTFFANSVILICQSDLRYGWIVAADGDIYSCLQHFH